jgi:hypothetical protein
MCMLWMKRGEAVGMDLWSTLILSTEKRKFPCEFADVVQQHP